MKRMIQRRGGIQRSDEQRRVVKRVEVENEETSREEGRSGERRDES